MRSGLRQRLLAGFALMVLLTIAVGVVGFVQGRQAAGMAAKTYGNDVRGMEVLSETLRDMFESRGTVFLELVTDDAGARRALDAKVAPLDGSIDARFDAMRTLWESPNKLLVLSELERAWSAYARVRDRIRALTVAGRLGEARRLTETIGRDTFGEVDEQVARLVTTIRRDAAARYANTRDGLATGRYATLALMSLAVAAAIVLAVRMARRIAGGIDSVTESAARLAAGDLGSRADVRTGDEIESLAASFNGMADRLQRMMRAERQAKELLETAVSEYSAFAARLAEGDLTARVAADTSPELHTLSDNLNGMAGALARLSGQVRDGAEHISASATQILAAVSQHATSAREQSTAINQTSATADQVRASAEDSARRAEGVAEQAEEAATASTEGLRAVDAIVTGMQDIRGRVDEIATGILALSGQMQHVGEIIDLVNDLADQSNLLAVNAAIEAAKAGDQGRGFAVVAGEVRTMAEQSKQATRQVRDTLAEVQRSADSAVMATEQGASVVEAGVRLAAQAGGVISRLSDMVQRAAQSSRQITVSAHEQSVGMDQIALAMRNLGQTTEQFLAGAQESEAAARSLNDVAGRFNQLTTRYRLAPR